MKNNSNAWKIISSIFSVLFFAIGVLNIIFVHFVPGVFYILLGFLYLPSVEVFIKKKFNFAIPPVVKIILGLVILWATLAVGDLMEVFEARFL